MRRTARRVALAIGGIAVAFLLAELGVRVVGDPRRGLVEEQRREHAAYADLLSGGLLRSHPDRERRYALRPGFDRTAGGRRYRVNALGLRGADVAVPPPAGAKRILALGDSFVFGLGVDDDDTIPAHLERALRRERPGTQVLNAGVPGYHTGQEVALLRDEGLRLAPDAVVLVFYTNDVTTEGFLYDERLRCLHVDLLPLPYAWKGTLARSAAYGALSTAVTRARREDLKAGRAKDWPVTRARLDAWVDLLRARGIPALVANLPFLTWTSDLRDPAWEWHEPYRRLEAWAAGRGVPCVGLLEPLRADFVEKLFVSVDPGRPEATDNHLNAAGCALVAGEIAKGLSPLLP